MNKHLFSATTATLSILATSAVAGELSIRGGVVDANQETYIYTLDNDDGTTPIDTGYGTGSNIALTFTSDAVMGNVGLELGLQSTQTSGSDDSNTPEDNNCHITTFLGIDTDCNDLAITENSTTLTEISALGVFDVANFQMVAGIGAIQFNNDVSAEYLYSGGYEYFVDRNTEFSGFGLRVGGRHSFPTGGASTVNIGWDVGAYQGTRTMQIDDAPTSGGAPSDQLTVEADTTVVIAEIRPSVSFPTTLFGNDGSIEVGVSFKTTNGLVDTRNYEDHGDLDTFDLGDENGRISFGSAFIGMTIPLN